MLKSCKLIRSSFHFLQRRHSSSGRVSVQLNFILQSSWLIFLPGRSNGLANPSGSYTVEIEDSTPFRFSGCSPLPNTKLIMSCSTSQWIPRALSKGKLSDFKSRSLICGARSSTGNADKTSRRFEIHLVSWKPPLASKSRSCPLRSTARSASANDFSKSST